MTTTKRQGHGYTHIDLGKLLKNLNSKKKASMYLLKWKSNDPVSWIYRLMCLQIIIKTKTSEQSAERSDAGPFYGQPRGLQPWMPQTSWAVFDFGQSREMKYFVIDVESQYSRNSNRYRSWFSERCNVSVSYEARLLSSENHHTKTAYGCHSTSSL